MMVLLWFFSRRSLRIRLRACLAGLGLNSCSSLTVTPVFELRRVAVRMHRSTIINQLKSCEARLNAVIFIGGRLRKRNSAKQALNGLTIGTCGSTGDGKTDT